MSTPQTDPVRPAGGGPSARRPRLVYFLLESLHFREVPVAFERTGGITSSLSTTIGHFAFLLGAGYYQLYFLVLLLEFYLRGGSGAMELSAVPGRRWCYGVAL
jgi:hypothetical protein